LGYFAARSDPGADIIDAAGAKARTLARRLLCSRRFGSAALDVAIVSFALNYGSRRNEIFGMGRE